MGNADVKKARYREFAVNHANCSDCNAIPLINVHNVGIDILIDSTCKKSYEERDSAKFQLPS